MEKLIIATPLNGQGEFCIVITRRSGISKRTGKSYTSAFFTGDFPEELVDDPAIFNAVSAAEQEDIEKSVAFLKKRD